MTGGSLKGAQDWEINSLITTAISPSFPKLILHFQMLEMPLLSHVTGKEFILLSPTTQNLSDRQCKASPDACHFHS